MRHDRRVDAVLTPGVAATDIRDVHPVRSRPAPATAGSLVAALLLTVGCTVSTPVPATVRTAGAAPSSDADGPVEQRMVTVESVTDGDTIVVSGGVRVRLIGVDTPETRHPDRGVECFGPEASARTSELLPPGEQVSLVYDEQRRDRFGRTLAYVHRSRDGLFVNATLVGEGYAIARSYPPNTAHDAEFQRLQAESRASGTGLWSACPTGEQPLVQAQPSLTPTPQEGGCDPAYPDSCIPAGPPNLDCAHIADRRFTALPPDPHHLDGDGNGIGCEGPD